MAEISCKNLSLGYDGKAVAENIDFTVNGGDYLCILGENGAGKSTLMKTVLSLQEPLSGEIKYGDGLKTTEIGYIPQRTDAQKDFPATVYEIVLSGCLSGLGFRPFYTKKQKETALENMELLGLSGFSKRCFRELSGGQQQRVLLARALCSTKKMLLLDEPVAGLDPIVTNELYETIDKLNKERKITIVMISHDISAALKYSSHILYVGKPCFFGSRDEFAASAFYAKIAEAKEA